MTLLNTLLVGIQFLLEAAAGSGLGAGLVTGLTGLGAGIGMGLAISKSVESISRQPEADGKIRGTLLIGLAFIETLAIYSLLVSILLIVL